MRYTTIATPDPTPKRRYRIILPEYGDIDSGRTIECDKVFYEITIDNINKMERCISLNMSFYNYNQKGELYMIEEWSTHVNVPKSDISLPRTNTIRSIIFERLDDLVKYGGINLAKLAHDIYRKAEEFYKEDYQKR